MKIKRKNRNKELSLPLGIGLGLLICVILTLAGTAAISHLTLTEKIGEQSITIWSKVILFIAVLIGAWGAVSATKQKRLQVSLLTGGIYNLLLLSMTAMFFGGRYQGVGITLLVVLAASAFVAFMPAKIKHNPKRRKRVFG